MDKELTDYLNTLEMCLYISYLANGTISEKLYDTWLDAEKDYYAGICQ